MKKYIIVIFIVFLNCKTQTRYFSEEENMWLYVNQNADNIHRPLKLELTEKWIESANSIDSLNQFKIDVLGKKYINLKIKDKGFSFDENWIRSKSKSKQTEEKLQEIGNYLSISKEKAEKLIIEFFDLGLNGYTKEKDYTLFINETWLTFSKGYLFFPEIYNIKEKDTINLNQLTKSNYREGWWNNFIIEKKINENWYEFYRPTGLNDIEQ